MSAFVAPSSGPVQSYARIGGILALVSMVAGGFGEAYVPSVLVVLSDAAATARNLAASDGLFRAGFAGDVTITLVLYALLRPVHRDLALLSVFFRLIGTAGFAVSELFYFAASPIAGGGFLQSFSQDQVNTLALLWLRMSRYGGGLFMMFYGAGTLLVGYLLFRSRYFPRFLGVLMAISGLGFMVRTFMGVLAPGYSTAFLLYPVGLAGLALTLWLLLRGVDLPAWHEHAASTRLPSL
jgi:hypothetical protein